MTNKETAKTEEAPTQRRLRSISAKDFALISDEFAKNLHPTDSMICEIHALRAERDALRKELAKFPTLDGALLIPCKTLAVQP